MYVVCIWDLNVITGIHLEKKITQYTKSDRQVKRDLLHFWKNIRVLKMHVVSLYSFFCRMYIFFVLKRISHANTVV